MLSLSFFLLPGGGAIFYDLTTYLMYMSQEHRSVYLLVIHKRYSRQSESERDRARKTNTERKRERERKREKAGVRKRD